MDHGDWSWVCNCGATIPRGPAGRQEHEAINAHAAQHRQEVAQTAADGRRAGPLPAKLVPARDFPPQWSYQMRLTNLQTGAVDARHTYGVENPAWGALRRHGGTPYQIAPQHDDDALPALARLDRAIQDVEDALRLVEQCQPPLPADSDRAVFRQRLAQVVNGLCSAGRDVARLQDDLLMTHATYDADCLQQHQYVPYEAQPMLQLDSEGGRYFSGRGRAFPGPLTIQEHLRRYGVAVGQAAQEAAMALLDDESAMRQDPTEAIGWTDYQMHLFGATSFADEEEGADLETVRAILAPAEAPLRVSVYRTQNRDHCTRASSQLQEVGIRFEVRGTALSRANTGIPTARLTEWQIFVRREDAQAAQTALGHD